MRNHVSSSLLLTLLFSGLASRAAAAPPSGAPPASQQSARPQALATMKRATTFMVERVAYKGGYVWSYLPDLSRRWGELGANSSMMWIQGGTPRMGQLFLDAYHATGDEYYYQSACQTADALISGQHPSGGWNYVVDMDGEDSLKKWYDTIGKNAWRLEEFQHHYGNATFDDSATVDAARFMLRMYLEKKEAKYKASLDRAIKFVIDSQYAMGGWPQRFPLASKGDVPDYTSYVTLNDDVASGNVDFLILCYGVLRDQKLLDPINRGMNAFVLLQQPKPQAGWALQYTPDDLKPAAARSYEPKALVTSTTVSAISRLLTYYGYTGDRKYLARIPEAIDWLDTVTLPTGLRGSHARFVELETNKPLFVHRSGSNVVSGRYFVDDEPQNTIGHYSSFQNVNTSQLRQRYAQVAAQAPEQVMRTSPLRPDAPPVELQRFMMGPGGAGGRGATANNESRVLQLTGSLNEAGYWPVTLRDTSNPYKGEPPKEATPGNFGSTNVGDQWDTSPYAAPPGGAVMGISLNNYISNMSVLIRYVDETR